MSSALEVWLSTFTSDWTKKQYRSYVKNFMFFIYGKGDVFELADKYLEENRNSTLSIMQDVDRYWASTSKFVAKTRLNKMGGIKIFFRDTYVELPDSFWRMFSTRGQRPRPVSKEMMLDAFQIHSLLAHLREVALH